MKKENLFFLAGLVLFFLACFLINPDVKNVLQKNDDLLFLKVTDTDLLRPLNKEKMGELYLDSNNFLSVFVNFNEDKEILLSEKKSDEKIAIASLTKLMTAVVVLENYDFTEQVTISPTSLLATGTAGGLVEKERISVEDLLYVMLIESSNDAAEAFAEKMGRKAFISKMNSKATEIGMKDTRFYNPSGLDIFTDSSETTVDKSNTSTPEDLKNLVVYILKEYPMVQEILSLSNKRLVSTSGVVHDLSNTNILLKENSAYLWGKTGYTKEANGCIILILKNYSHDGEGYIINVITGADDRFREARKLEDWLKNSFIW